MTGPPARHRALPHTADAQVEAWAPSREECLRQAVLGSVDLFVNTAGAVPVDVAVTSYAGDVPLTPSGLVTWDV